MGLDHLLGQDVAVATLERALRSGRAHHCYRFEGPDGVGKETAAFALARALLCERADALGCGECSACKRAGTFAEDPPEVSLHPDLLLVERGLYPESLLGKSEATGISVEQVRRIVLGRLGFPPHEGRARVVIVRRADELTTAAANALLKTLEEPPSGTHFVLLTSQPGRLLDTVRSRSLAVRFRPLSPVVMARVLANEGVEVTDDLLAAAQGSLTLARSLADPEARRARDDFVEQADRAMQAEHGASAIDFAEGRPEGRDALLSMLGHLAVTFAGRARSTDDGHTQSNWARRYQIVRRASDEVERNASPALVLESMITDLRAQAAP